MRHRTGRVGQTLPVLRRVMDTSFRARLIAIVVLGLAWRVGYVLVTKRHAAVWGDSVAYHYGANILADGKGFLDPLRYEFSGLEFPSAAHPPLYVTYLAAWSLVGLKSALWHRLASCLLGAATVGLVGLLGRRLAGRPRRPDRGRAGRRVPAPLAQRRGAALRDRGRVRGRARDAGLSSGSASSRRWRARGSSAARSRSRCSVGPSSSSSYP